MAAPTPSNACELLGRIPSTGASIPVITLGTWKAKSETARAAVAFAIKSGVRSIDTASEYGNEEDVGLGIADGLREAGISRELLFITTKLWNDDHGRVEEACKESMKKLNVSYLNAYLMHYPIAGRGETVQPPIADTWREMEKLVDAGLVRHIGVANFSIPKLVKLKESAVKPISILQCESHPMFPNDELYAFAQREGILFEAYSVLGSRDSAGHEGVHPLGGPELLEQEALLRVAQKVSKSPAQVCMRWALQRHPDAVLLVKSCTPEHLKEDLEVCDFTLDDDDIKALDSLPRRRFVSGEIFLSPEGPYRTMQELWDD